MLLTPRLLLRPWVMADAEEVARICNDPEIAAATARLPHPYTLDHARQWIQDRIDGKADGADRAITFACCLRDGADPAAGPPIAACGLRVHDAQGRAELGYWVAREHWGRGFATEAARAVVDHGFEALSLRRMTADYYRRNTASGRVLEKLGFTIEGCLRSHVVRFGRIEDLVLTGLLREEWQRRRGGDGGG